MRQKNAPQLKQQKWRQNYFTQPTKNVLQNLLARQNDLPTSFIKN